VLEDVTTHPRSRREEVSHRLDLPATTVRRTLDSLQLLKVLTRKTSDTEGITKVHRYSVAEDLDPSVLHPVSEKVSRRDLGEKKRKR
jgi:predicted transcriptional regulator